MAWRYRRTVRKYQGFRMNMTTDMVAFASWLINIILDGAPTVEQCMPHAESWLYYSWLYRHYLQRAPFLTKMKYNDT
jgi:hypothetical protein